MTPLTLDLETIIDYGALISLIGKDQATGRRVAVHLDYRLHPCPPGDMRPASGSEPVRLAAHGLAVGVEFAFTADITDEPATMPLIQPPRRPDR